MDISHLNEKLLSLPEESQAVIVKAIEKFYHLSLGENPLDTINSEYSKCSASLCEASSDVLDAMRHSIAVFAQGGLRDLYVYQANECWYPRIILTKVLEHNDIANLPNSIEIYRGCNIDELEKMEFGQSWTTSLEIAKNFAYGHYESQDWYEQSCRVVLKGTIRRENVFYSDQSENGEYEVSVETSKLMGVVEYA